jgi:hypothetical protein
VNLRAANYAPGDKLLASPFTIGRGIFATFLTIFATNKLTNCCAAFVRLLLLQCFSAAQWDAGGPKNNSSPRKTGKPG